MRYSLGLTLFILVSLTASAADLCIAPRQQDVDPKKTPIPLCLVAKKVALMLDQYNKDPKTLKGAVPSLSKVDFDFKTVSSTTVGFKFSILIFSVGGQPSILVDERRDVLVCGSSARAQEISVCQAARFLQGPD